MRGEGQHKIFKPNLDPLRLFFQSLCSRKTRQRKFCAHSLLLPGAPHFIFTPTGPHKIGSVAESLRPVWSWWEHGNIFKKNPKKISFFTTSPVEYLPHLVPPSARIFGKIQILPKDEARKERGKASGRIKDWWVKIFAPPQKHESHSRDTQGPENHSFTHPN